MKKVAIGIIALLVLTLITMYVIRQNEPSTIRSELTDFAIEDTASVARIILQDESGNVIDLQRQSPSYWTVNGTHRARPDAIRILLTTMKKVSIKAPISQQSMSTVLKRIIASHTLVEAYDKEGKLIKTYYVGGANKEHTGTNMMIKGSSRPFVVHIEGFHGFLTPRYFTNELEWRSRDVFELEREDIASIHLQYPSGKGEEVLIEKTSNGYRIERNGKEVMPGQIDTLMLSAYLNQYAKVHYESYEETKSDEFLDSVKTSQPVFILDVVETNGKQKRVIGFRKPLKNGYDLEGNPIKFDQDRLYIWVDSGEIFIGQYAIFDPLTKGLYFFKEG
ncbi:MAG: hypothetical protein Kow0075_11760 [Salibacteraceae bacterium]